MNASKGVEETVLFVDGVNCCIYMLCMNVFRYPPHESLGFMTVTANRLMSAFLRRKMKEAGIDFTSEQWGILIQLWQMDGATQEELAAVACVDKSSMSRVLSLMEDKGLIVRRVDPDNARRKIIRASDGSRALQGRSLAVVHEVLDLTLEGVAPEDLATTLRVLATVKDNLRT